jgi:hypothetical protein
MAHEENKGVDRRQALECMIWAGTGVLWTLAGGVPKSSLLGSAQAAEAGFSFLQISDSHVGFDKPANPDALGTLREAVGKVVAMPAKPAFMIHTGDITHLSKPKQFDDADRVIGEARLDVHYLPGQHDVIDETQGKAYLERYGKNATGAGWYSFDQGACSRRCPTCRPANSTPSAPRFAAPPPPSAKKRRSLDAMTARPASRPPEIPFLSAPARRACRSAPP